MGAGALERSSRWPRAGRSTLSPRKPKTDLPLALRARSFVRALPNPAEPPQLPRLKAGTPLRTLLVICRLWIRLIGAGSALSGLDTPYLGWLQPIWLGSALSGPDKAYLNRIRLLQL